MAGRLMLLVCVYLPDDYPEIDPDVFYTHVATQMRQPVKLLVSKGRRSVPCPLAVCQDVPDEVPTLS